MLCGIFAGITWALETVILGIALSLSPFISGSNGIFLAPFISTFIHDMLSGIYLLIMNTACGNLKKIAGIFKPGGGYGYLLISSAIGGPIGMTGYVIAVKYMGASVGAVASAVYPAIGSLLAYIFLKEKIRWYQWIFLLCTLFGVFALSYSPQIDIQDFRLGLTGVLMCAFGWGSEGVILSKCFKKHCIKSEFALQIRQIVSAAIYGIIIIPLLGGVKLTLGLFKPENVTVLLIIAAAAFFATVSYLLYYKAIAKIGVAKAMGLNITYTAWAMIFSVIILHNYGAFNPRTVICSAAVVLCALLAAADFKEIFK